MNIKTKTYKYIALIILLGFSAIIVLLRLHTFDEPIERDIATYAVIGHEMLKGRSLYSDLWDHKPPAIHITYAIAEELVGYGQVEIYFLSLVAAVLTLLGIYRAGTAGGLGFAGGFWASAIWTVIATDLQLQANEPNVEVFINAILIWTFSLLILPKPKVSQINLCGILLAIGSLYKPQIAIFTILFTLTYFFFPGGKNRFLNTFKILLRLIIPLLLAWILCYLYFDITHRSKDFYDTVFTYNRFYGEHLRQNLRNGLRLENLIPNFIWFLSPVVFLTLMSFLISFHQLTKPWFLLGAYVVGAYISVALPGKFFAHYYQYWLPVVSVGGGWGIVILGKQLKTFTKSLYLVPGILCLIFLICYEVPNYLLDADNWSIKKYGPEFVNCEKFGKTLYQNLNPSQSFLILGDQPSIYFYSRESPPTGLIFTKPTIDGPLAPYLSKRLLNDITAQKPDFLIFDQPSFCPDLKAFLVRYHFSKYYLQRYKIFVSNNLKLDSSKSISKNNKQTIF